MSDDSLMLDTLFGELQHWYRRQILAFFDESGRKRADLDELVDHLRAQHDETSDPDRLAVILHHKTLPALTVAGFIEYDPETHTARDRETLHVESALHLMDEMTDVLQ